MPVEMVLRGRWFGTYLCGCTVSLWPSLQHSTSEAQINAQSLRLCWQSWSQKLRVRGGGGGWAVMVLLFVTFVPKQNIESSRRGKKKKWRVERFQLDWRKITSRSQWNIWYPCQLPSGLRRSRPLRETAPCFQFGYLSKFIFGRLPAGLFFFPNQLTQLDNPAFLFSLKFFSLLPFPFSVSVFFSVAHF